MKKSMFVLGLFAAGLMVASGPGLSRAGDLEVTGFADIQYFIDNEHPALDPAGGRNVVERQFVVKGEIDFEKETDNLTFRMDLDFPSSETGTDANPSVGQTFANTNMSVSGLPGGPNTLAEHLEQLKFVWAITGEESGNIWLEGGLFNSPIGYESQDAPDRDFISYGQLFGLVPSNLGGIQLGASHGPISVSVLYTDEWRSVSGQGGAVTVGNNVLPASEENSFGGTIAFNPMPAVGLSIGYLTSEQNSGGFEDEDVVDIILSGSIMPSSELELSYAAEFLQDKNNDAYMITTSVKHGKHALSLRYDSVSCDGVSVFCGGGTPATPARTPASLTVSASCDVAKALTARLEWSTYEASGFEFPADNDMLSVQFVANLM